MSFVMASSEPNGHSNARFPNADVLVKITPAGSKGHVRATLVAYFSAKACNIALLRIGDRCDVGIDPASNSVRLVLMQDANKPNPVRLCLAGGHKSNADTGRRVVSLVLRQGWNIIITAQRPLMPCTHVQIERGMITARLPESWSSFWRKV